MVLVHDYRTRETSFPAFFRPEFPRFISFLLNNNTRETRHPQMRALLLTSCPVCISRKLTLCLHSVVLIRVEAFIGPRACLAQFFSPPTLPEKEARHGPTEDVGAWKPRGLPGHGSGRQT